MPNDFDSMSYSELIRSAAMYGVKRDLALAKAREKRKEELPLDDLEILLSDQYDTITKTVDRVSNHLVDIGFNGVAKRIKSQFTNYD